MDWKPRTRICNGRPNGSQEECLCISQGHGDHQLIHSKQLSEIVIFSIGQRQDLPCSPGLLLPSSQTIMTAAAELKAQEHLRDPWDDSMILCTKLAACE